MGKGKREVEKIKKKRKGKEGGGEKERVRGGKRKRMRGEKKIPEVYQNTMPNQ